MIEPAWWHAENRGDGTRVARCTLCCHTCIINPGETGLCRARAFTVQKEFVSPYLGGFVSVAVDPVEKKPLNRWRPGTFIYSLGSVGCNAFCQFCQNHAIAHPEGDVALCAIPPEDLLRRVEDAGLSSVAYTYNEPTLQAEYIVAAAPLLREAGIASVMVTNGLFSEDARDSLANYVDAINIDVKTFSDEKYEKLGGSLDTVKSNVTFLAGRGVHIELTCLVVPGVSDSEDEFADMVDWIAGISKDIPLHISRYFPAYRYTAPPTSLSLMERLEQHAKSRLDYVYLGNV